MDEVTVTLSGEIKLIIRGEEDFFTVHVIGPRGGNHVYEQVGRHALERLRDGINTLLKADQ